MMAILNPLHLSFAVDLVHGDNSLCCQTCPYIYTLDRSVRPSIILCMGWSQPASPSGKERGNDACCSVQMQLIKNVTLKRKEVDDVLGGEEAWANVQKTDGERQFCGGNPETIDYIMIFLYFCTKIFELQQRAQSAATTRRTLWRSRSDPPTSRPRSSSNAYSAPRSGVRAKR